MAVLARRLAEHRGTTHVGFDEGEGIHERAVDVRLGGEVDDRVHLGGQRVDDLRVADVAANEPIAAAGVEFREVGEVARVGELVEHRDLHLRTRAPQVPDEVGADEARGPRDEQALERAAHLIAGPEAQS